MTGIRVCLVSIILTIIYVFTTVMLSNLLFHSNSNGSLIKANDKIIGSKLLGQNFTNAKYFHNRPSLYKYKNDISGNSNFPYYSKELKDYIANNYSEFLKLNHNTTPDLNLITESASGLDPHITFKGAISQVNRIVNSSQLNKEKIIKLIQKKSSPRILGLFGEKIVNVLELNLELKKLYAKTTRSG
ncbi:MAG: potassium-transporting ATPase subunit C [Candidatus Melainabacteria bacterium]|nr:potassium-transporting ATPase subunit C [Candidatus Melainabacteria bacterium]